MFFLERIIGDSLTRKLGMFQEPMYDEIRRRVDKVLGADGKRLEARKCLQQLTRH